MSVDVVVGLQRGDEGKGRFVDALAATGQYDAVARFGGGPNAGHTIILPGDEYHPDDRVLKLHLVPSGIAHESVINVIGRGVLVDAAKLADEIDTIQDMGIDVTPENLRIDGAATLILPHHISEDEIREAGAGQQGTTKSGIAPAAASKMMRAGARVESIAEEPDVLHALVLGGLRKQRQMRLEAGLGVIDEEAVAAEYIRKARLIAPYIMDVTVFLNRELARSEPVTILAEGAQAFQLDVDQGMSPFTTSSITTSGGVAPGLGIPPQKIRRVIGVAKATQSHVGGGPFPTEELDSGRLARLYGDMTAVDAEYGATTGRLRRLGHLDLPQIRRAVMVNGVNDVALTKLDWLPRYGKTIPVCVAYEANGVELDIAPDSAKKLERFTPKYVELPNWTEDISDVRHFEDLPANAQNYVRFVEQQLGVPISMIGVGPKHYQVIMR